MPCGSGTGPRWGRRSTSIDRFAPQHHTITSTGGPVPAIHLLRVVALSLALLAIGAAAITTRSFAAQQALEVHAAGNAYAPPSLMVPTGTAIRFVNDDAEIHTVTRLG